MASWNLWHGCQRISPGCDNCYVYSGDKRYDREDTFIVRKTADFDLPIRRRRDGGYKLVCEGDEVVSTCFTSDFFVEDADCWRPDAWRMMKERSDLVFFMITKRIHRLEKTIPPDWGDGYDNVVICCTVENQKMADFRIPILVNAPIKHRLVTCSPLLERIDLEKYLTPENRIKCVSVGGETGESARICDYDWILDLQRQCVRTNTGFYFHQTGKNFVKDGKHYIIPRKMQHSQAKKAGIDLPYER